MNLEKWIEEFEDLWLGDTCEYFDCWNWCKQQNKELFLKAEEECKKVFDYNYTEIVESNDTDWEEYDSYDRYNAIRFTLDYFWEYYGYELDYEFGLSKKDLKQVKEFILKVLEEQDDKLYGKFITPNQIDFYDLKSNIFFKAIEELIKEGIIRQRDCIGIAYEFNVGQ